MPTRTIETQGISNTHTFSGSGSITFYVTSDTGAASGGKVTGAQLTLSRIRSWSSRYGLDIAFDGVTVGTTENVGSVSSTSSVVLNVDDTSSGLIENSVFSLTLSVAPTGSIPGDSISFRDGCHATLNVYYEESEPGPDVPTPEEPKQSNVQYWTGSTWLTCDVLYWTGTTWLNCTVLYDTGTGFI